MPQLCSGDRSKWEQCESACRAECQRDAKCNAFEINH